MALLPTSISISLAVLAAFLIFITALKYAIENTFIRTRLIMTSFFVFIVFTLSISFWEYSWDSLPYAVPSFFVGIALGYLFGVRAAEQKLRMEGLEHYMEHFAHIHEGDLKALTWWSFVNFYSIMGSLLLINLIGLSSVIFQGSESWALATSAVGALLIGSILPYLAHLWSIRTPQKIKSTISEP